MSLESKIDSIEISQISDMIPLKKWLDLGSIAKKRAIIEAQSHNHTIRLLDIDSKRFVTEPDFFIKSQLLNSAYYGFDRPCIDYDFYNIESESLGQEMVFCQGLLPEIDFSNPLIKEKKDLYGLKPSIAKGTARFDFVLGINRLYKKIFGLAPKLRFCGPFSIAVNLRGYSKLMMDMADDKGFVKDLFDFITFEVIIPWVELQRKDLGETDALAGGIEATATFPNISARTMDEWIIPYYQKAKERLSNLTFTTCCGGIASFNDPDDYFYYQLSTCPDKAKGYQWDTDRIGFKVFNDYAREHDLDLRLGISAQTLLEIKPEEVETLVKRYLEEGGAGLSSYSIFISDIDPSTDPRIICYLVSAVKQLGAFPLKKDIKKAFKPPDFIDFKQWFASKS